jgi:hypothetical protein
MSLNESPLTDLDLTVTQYEPEVLNCLLFIASGRTNRNHDNPKLDIGTYRPVPARDRTQKWMLVDAMASVTAINAGHRAGCVDKIGLY